MVSIATEKKEYVLAPITRIRNDIFSFQKGQKTTLKLIIGFGIVGLWPVSLFLLIKNISEYFLKIRDPYFKDNNTLAHIRAGMMPMQPTQFAPIGYRVYDEELGEHINWLAGMTEKSTGAEMSKRADEKKSKFWLSVGLAKDSLTRHIAFIGTTGSGKTVSMLIMIMSFLKKGGGFFMVDAKADASTMMQCYTIAKENKRDYDFFAVNMLKPENCPSTNTINFLESLPPNKALDLLMNLVPGGEGNAEHFKNMGLSLLRPVVFSFYMRRDIFNEPFGLGNIGSMLSPQELAILSILSYGVARDIEEAIKSSDELAYVRSRSAGYRQPRMLTLETCDVMFGYVNSNDVTGEMKALIEKVVGIKYIQQTIYLDKICIGAFDFINKINGPWKDVCFYMAQIVYEVTKDKGKNFIGTNTVSFADVRQIVDEVVKMIEKGAGAAKRPAPGAKPSDMPPPSDDIIKTMTKGKMQKEDTNIKQIASGILTKGPDGGAMEQFGYATQTLNPVFNAFESQKAVFDSAIADIDFFDAFKNSKILFVLLPKMEMQEDVAEVLGKIFTVLIKQAIAPQLGDEIGRTKVQFAILKDRVTPKPILGVLFDEFGSFGSRDAIDINAQARSTNTCVAIGAQDYVSLGGRNKDDFMAERLWSNMAKYILKTTDNTTGQKVNELLPEIELSSKKLYDSGYGRHLSDNDLNIGKQKVIDTSILRGFKNGMGMLLFDQNPVFVQASFYDPKQSNVLLTKLVAA